MEFETVFKVFLTGYKDNKLISEGVSTTKRKPLYDDLVEIANLKTAEKYRWVEIHKQDTYADGYEELTEQARIEIEYLKN